ncbi:hypothetical protein LTR08_005649 [Meristemomyces frigidus]|nr:hypothetical protein LTR08_005649 [Meristemomyces frigidus]
MESYFGVLNVETMCLTALPKGAEYVAFSYTWGERAAQNADPGVEHFKTRLDNVESLKVKGGMMDVFDRLPRAIQDCIGLVKRLGFKFLWVDALCILQDDQEVWSLNARNMDLIYGNANLTICAADGSGARDGLAALNRGPDNPQVTQYIAQYKKGVELMVSYPSESYCRTTTMSEDIHAEQAYTGWSLELHDAPMQRFKKVKKDPVNVYTLSVQLFTERALTHEGDILAAFGGIAKVICAALGGTPLFGLPTSHFDLALLREPEDAAQRRRPDGTLKFPSWSWCGWKGQTMVHREHMIKELLSYGVHEWLIRRTWITWYIRDGRGNLRLVWDAPDVDLYGRKVPPESDHMARNAFQRTLPKYPYQVRMVRPGDSSSRTDERLEDQRYLQFWTWSAYFYITPADEKNNQDKRDPLVGRLSRRYIIQDMDKDTVGTIILPSKWAKPAEGGPGSDAEDPQELVPDNNMQYEFVAISEARGFTKEEFGDWNWYLDLDMAESEWDVYNVLLLGYDEDPGGKIARRVGLGKILKKGFDRACERHDEAPLGKLWKEIILG